MAAAIDGFRLNWLWIMGHTLFAHWNSDGEATMMKWKEKMFYQLAITAHNTPHIPLKISISFFRKLLKNSNF